MIVTVLKDCFRIRSLVSWPNIQITYQGSQTWNYKKKVSICVCTHFIIAFTVSLWPEVHFILWIVTWHPHWT